MQCQYINADDIDAALMPCVMSRAFFIDISRFIHATRVKCQSGFAPFHSNFHSICTSVTFLIALILQLQLLSLAQVCRLSFLRTLISSLESLYICKDGYLRLAWQDDAENTQWMELLQPFTAVKNLILSKEFAPCIASCFPSRSS